MKKDPYRRIARHYDHLFQSMNAGLTGIGMTLARPQTGMTVLDVGCGTGLQLAQYQQAGCMVVGLDKSPSMLQAAQQKLGQTAELHYADATQMPFANNRFDLITATLVLHEMAPAVRDGVMGEMKRVLKDNGRLLFTDYHPGPLRPPQGWTSKFLITIAEVLAGRDHFRHYRHFMAHKGLPDLLAAHGLVVEKQKIVSGGNMGVFLLRQDEAR
ncbi:MAG: class I SAM-dependent methyltransferase [Ardenticatenaceae bacterium]|nr:class I SAM-dependent methyltransferase [Ardenticatenaceae bacterium]